MDCSGDFIMLQTVHGNLKPIILGYPYMQKTKHCVDYQSVIIYIRQEVIVRPGKLHGDEKITRTLIIFPLGKKEFSAARGCMSILVALKGRPQLCIL